MIERASNRILYIVFIVGSIAWCAAAKAEDPNELIWEALEYIKEYQIEQKKTQPDDAINTAIESWEDDYGSYDTTEQEELLQLSSDGD